MVRLSIPQRETRKSYCCSNECLILSESWPDQPVLLPPGLRFQRRNCPAHRMRYHLSGRDYRMVCFSMERRIKSHRRFKIKRDQNDDFASLREVLQRRFEEARQGNPAFLPEPDMILIDGGLGQVNAVARVLKDLQIDIPLFSLAKKQEEIYRPGSAQALRLPPSDPGLKLLQRLRDEAHRFAIEYNRQRRQKKTRISSLDGIPRNTEEPHQPDRPGEARPQ